MVKMTDTEVHKWLKSHRKNDILLDNYHKSRKNITFGVIFNKVKHLEIKINHRQII